MKKLVVLSLIVVMLAVSVVPAFAAGPSSNRGSGTGVCTGSQTGLANRSQALRGYGRMGIMSTDSVYTLSGTITGLDAVAGTVTVEVVCGYRSVTEYIGTPVTLQTTEATRFLLRVPGDVATVITFADLEVGQNVSSQGTLADGAFTAIRITTGAELICLSSQ